MKKALAIVAACFVFESLLDDSTHSANALASFTNSLATLNNSVENLKANSAITSIGNLFKTTNNDYLNVQNLHNLLVQFYSSLQSAFLNNNTYLTDPKKYELNPDLDQSLLIGSNIFFNVFSCFSVILNNVCESIKNKYGDFLSKQSAYDKLNNPGPQTLEKATAELKIPMDAIYQHTSTILGMGFDILCALLECSSIIMCKAITEMPKNISHANLTVLQGQLDILSTKIAGLASNNMANSLVNIFYDINNHQIKSSYYTNNQNVQTILEYLRTKINMINTSLNIATKALMFIRNYACSIDHTVNTNDLTIILKSSRFSGMYNTVGNMNGLSYNNVMNSSSTLTDPMFANTTSYPLNSGYSSNSLYTTPSNSSIGSTQYLNIPNSANLPTNSLTSSTQSLGSSYMTTPSSPMGSQYLSTPNSPNASMNSLTSSTQSLGSSYMTTPSSPMGLTNSTNNQYYSNSTPIANQQLAPSYMQTGPGTPINNLSTWQQPISVR